MHFLPVYRGLKSCTSLLENISIRVPPSNLMDFSSFGVCLSKKYRPSARCAYAANVVKDLGIFAIGAIFLNHILLNNLKLLIIFVHNPNVLGYVVLSCHVLVTSLHFSLFICLFVYFFCIDVFFPPVLTCNLSLTLCCVCPWCNYLYLHCVVSVIGLIAVDSAHK
jgi:hypothetical protein